MDKNQLLSLLSKESKDIVKKYIPDNSSVFYTASCFCLDEKYIPALEELITNASFQNYLSKKNSASPTRLEGNFISIFRRLALDIPSVILGKICIEMVSKEYRKLESTFYTIPVDKDGYDIFEREFIYVGEQKIDLLKMYLSFCSSERWISLRYAFKNIPTLYEDIYHRLVNYFLLRESLDELYAASKNILEPFLLRFIFSANSEGKAKEFMRNIFELFHSHCNFSFFLKLVKTVYTRYPEKRETTSNRYERNVYNQLMSLWELIKVLPEEKYIEFKNFLYNYGDIKDEIQTYIWEEVLSLETVKIIQILSILNSTPFAQIKNYYGEDKAMQKFVVKNIINAVAELKLHKFETKLYKLVLRSLLFLKLDKNFVKRRSAFFYWLKKQTSSIRLEMEFMRFSFMEYLFVSMGKVPNIPNMKMTMYCDGDHQFVCIYIDEIYPKLKDKKKIEADIFTPILDRIRQIVYKPYTEKFKEWDFQMKELQSASISVNKEDLFLYALENLSPDHFVSYYESFMEIFKADPDNIQTAMLPDYWYRVTLYMASSYIYSVVLPVVGSIEIMEGNMGAYTDGKTIFLPTYINYFLDPLDPLLNNRNLALYIALALHEAGHIIGGSFKFDLSYYYLKLEKPHLFQRIMNAIEDYRIESFLIRIKAHPQIEDLIKSMNEYFTSKNVRYPENIAVNFILYIIDEVTENNSLSKNTSLYQESIAALMNANLYTGRFSSIKELCEYCITRIRNIDIGNPLASYPIAREIYEIMKVWSDTSIQSLADPTYCPTGIHSNENHLNISPKPLNREQLDALYKEYNENPKAFLERNELPIYSEIVNTKDGKNAIEIDQDDKNKIVEYINEIFEEMLSDTYIQPGTIDLSHRTKADDLLAENQKNKKKDVSKDKQPNNVTETSDTDKKKKKTSSKNKRIYSIDPKTKSRTKLTEVKVFSVTDTNHLFMRKFQKWKHISMQVYRYLSLLLPTVQEDHDTSAIEGELNMELLVEALSEKSKLGSIEFLDIFTESSRTLEVVIGLDISGSTMLVIQDIDVTGTPTIVNGLPVIKFELSDEDSLKYDTIIDIEKAFAMIFADALSYLTPNVSIYAFNSITSTNIYKAKNINAISSFESDGANRDGDFIRYIHSVLKESNADIKYFFLLTDGQPNADNYSGKEALEDTLIAMRETINSGIRLIYFNIDTEKKEYFEMFQKEATFARYFSKPEEVLPIIPEMVHTIVNSIR